MICHKILKNRVFVNNIFLKKKSSTVAKAINPNRVKPNIRVAMSVSSAKAKVKQKYIEIEKRISWKIRKKVLTNCFIKISLSIWFHSIASKIPHNTVDNLHLNSVTKNRFTSGFFGLLGGGARKRHRQVIITLSLQALLSILILGRHAKL